ncbi:hypothetical protein [Aquimarina algicola]|uniref:Uncharacterized protein n=1 Tax=Aquimarina algicola TaxID=2589995 RepID=A0A504JIH4_9FLAO|nr:hypothetical protein [Aquimarina algicola]TPN86300.1 hypothetical protein FHK87_13620 [Aquimarina algicola]
MIKTKPKFNSSLTLVIAIINTILLFSFLLEVNDGENERLYYFVIFWVVTAIQLGFIAYFDTSKNKKIYKILCIIAVIITLIAIALLAYFMALASAFKN